MFNRLTNVFRGCVSFLPSPIPPSSPLTFPSQAVGVYGTHRETSVWLGHTTEIMFGVSKKEKRTVKVLYVSTSGDCQRRSSLSREEVWVWKSENRRWLTASSLFPRIPLFAKLSNDFSIELRPLWRGKEGRSSLISLTVPSRLLPLSSCHYSA